MKRRIGSVCMIIGLVLILAAIAMFSYNTWDSWRAGQSVAEIGDVLKEAVEDTADPYGGSENDTVLIDGYEYIGTLAIPSLGLELPIMDEWSYAGLKVAPGRYNGLASTGDLIICGHNYERHFGNLKYLEAGDRVTFTDVNDHVFDYEVTEVTMLLPTDVEKMLSRDESEWDMTLFTCTIGGQARVTVRCSRIEE
ncbi:MAG: sortase [Clostridiales bacterium]|nr:sortase [Clostridiales bacterium]